MIDPALNELIARAIARAVWKIGERVAPDAIPEHRNFNALDEVFKDEWRSVAEEVIVDLTKLGLKIVPR